MDKSEIKVHTYWTFRLAALDKLSEDINKERSDNYEFHKQFVINYNKHPDSLVELNGDVMGITVDDAVCSDPALLPTVKKMLDSGEFLLRELLVREFLAQPSEWHVLNVNKMPPIALPWQQWRPASSTCIPDDDYKFCKHHYFSRYIHKHAKKAFPPGEIQIIQVADQEHSAGDNWAQIIPTKAMGRGLDHPNFDAASVTTPPALRYGITEFEAIRKDARFYNQDLNELLPYAFEHKARIRVESFPRFWRGALPANSVTGYFWAPNAVFFCSNKSDSRFRAQIYFNLSPVLVEEEATGGRENLDNVYGPAPEYLFGIGAASSNEEARAIMAGNQAKSSSKSPKDDLAVAVNRLKAAKKRLPKAFSPPLKNEPDFTARGLPPIPAAWLSVLKVADGFKVERRVVCCEKVLSAAAIAEQTLHMRKLAFCDEFTVDPEIEEPPEDARKIPEHYLFVASDEERFCVLDLSKLTPAGDCPVLALSWDCDYAAYEWATVADFVSAMFEDSSP
jgi:hypothetical protein